MFNLVNKLVSVLLSRVQKLIWEVLCDWDQGGLTSMLRIAHLQSCKDSDQLKLAYIYHTHFTTLGYTKEMINMLFTQ